MIVKSRCPLEGREEKLKMKISNNIMRQLRGARTPEYTDTFPANVSKRDILIHRINRRGHEWTNEDHWHAQRALKTSYALNIAFACIDAVDVRRFNIIYCKNKHHLDTKAEELYGRAKTVLYHGVIDVLPILVQIDYIHKSYEQLFFSYLLYLMREHGHFKNYVYAFLTEYTRLGVIDQVFDGDGRWFKEILFQPWGHEPLHWIVRVLFDIGYLPRHEFVLELIRNHYYGIYKWQKGLFEIWKAMITNASSGENGNEVLRSCIEKVVTGANTHTYLSIFHHFMTIPTDTRLGQCICEYMGMYWQNVLGLYKYERNNFLYYLLYLIEAATYIMEKHAYLRHDIRMYFLATYPILWAEKIDLVVRYEENYPYHVRRFVDFFLEMGLITQELLDDRVRTLYVDPDFVALNVYPKFVSLFPVSDNFKETIVVQFLLKSFSIAKKTTIGFVTAHAREIIEYMTRIIEIVREINTPMHVSRFELFWKFPGVSARNCAEFYKLPSSDRVSFYKKWIPGVDLLDPFVVQLHLGRFAMEEFVDNWFRWHYRVYRLIQSVVQGMDWKCEFHFILEMMGDNPNRRFLTDDGKPWQSGSLTNLPPEVWEHVASFILGIDLKVYRPMKRFLDESDARLWNQIWLDFNFIDS